MFPTFKFAPININWYYQLWCYQHQSRAK